MNWIDICLLSDIPLCGARKIKTAFGCVALFHTSENEVFAVSDQCPHKGGPLSEGIVHGQSVTCPLHNWVFDLNTGKAVGENGSIKTFPVQVRGGRVFVDAAKLQSWSAA